MKKTFVMILAMPLVACAWGAPASAAPLFLDTFELVDHSSGVLEEDINDELPGPRQPGDVGSTYTEGGSVFIQDATVPNGTDALVLRTVSIAGAAVGSSADLDVDFGSQLAGNKYRVMYEGQVDHTGGIAADNWQAFGIGDLSTVDAPNGADTDLGILFRLNGDWTVFLDGVGVLGGANGSTPDSGIRAGLPYSIQYDFDETGPNPLVSITVDATLGPVTLDLFGGAIDALGPGTGFENAGRFFELRVFQGDAGANGELIDTRLDNLKIEIIPEPTAVAILGIGCLGMLTTRIRRR